MRKIEKKITITIIILTNNNDIYNTGIVTSSGKAMTVCFYGLNWTKKSKKILYINRTV